MALYDILDKECPEGDILDNGGVAAERDDLFAPVQANAPPVQALRIIPAFTWAEDQELTDAIVSGIRKALPFDADIQVALPRGSAKDELDRFEVSYDAARKQYVLPWSLTQPVQAVPTLVITDADLTARTERGIKNFVFGRTYLGERLTITSTFRFSHSNRRKFISRNVKNAQHEIGHLFGLGSSAMPLSDGEHCASGNCAMQFSKNLTELDRVAADFCPDCKNLLSDKFGNAGRAGQG